jgi:hypothetical protein
MSTAAETATDSTAIRPFHIEVPEEQLAELRRRIEATRWPPRELVDDRSQGVQLATMQELASYRTTEYDWRKCEARLNALPQFTTEIDGVVIHFIHVKSPHEDALPLIMTHGWPGSPRIRTRSKATGRRAMQMRDSVAEVPVPAQPNRAPPPPRGARKGRR